MTDQELMQMANRIEALAFEMKAPNVYTPRFVMLANEIREAIRARLAQPEWIATTYVGDGQRERNVYYDEAKQQPEQEPGACIVKGCRNRKGEGLFVGDLCSPCHTFITTGEGKYSQAYRNSQREWQGLTDEEIGEIIEASQITLKNYCSEEKQTEFARAIEAKLRRKNEQPCLF